VELLEDHHVHGEGAGLVRQQVGDPAQLLGYGGGTGLGARDLLVPTCRRQPFFSAGTTSVADPDPGSGALLTVGSGMGKKSGSRITDPITDPDHGSGSQIRIADP
jgi:hypothetical protein